MPETCTPALSRSIMFRYSENCSVIEPKQAIINQNGTPLPRNSITSLTEHFGEMTNTTSTGSYTSAIRMTLWPGLVRNVLLRRVIRHRQPTGYSHISIDALPLAPWPCAQPVCLRVGGRIRKHAPIYLPPIIYIDHLSGVSHLNLGI